MRGNYTQGDIMPYIVKQSDCIYSFSNNPHQAVKLAREWIGQNVEIKSEDPDIEEENTAYLVYATPTLYKALTENEENKNIIPSPEDFVIEDSVKFSRLSRNIYGLFGESVHTFLK